ncbi:MAG TPA: hypothetical protein VK151_14230 [Fluviicola sp.]|nr:hypothetical protein [Fluviicola sp.]
MTKAALLAAARTLLSNKQQDFQSMIADLQEGLANETKSSAGDKYETSRAMSQQELDKITTQLQEISRQLALIPHLETVTGPGTIQNGSIVETNKGFFFIGLPLGSLQTDEGTVFCIGASAPLAQQLIGKNTGAKVVLNANRFEVLGVY